MKLLVTFGPIFNVVHTKKKLLVIKNWIFFNKIAIFKICYPGNFFVCAINLKPQKIGLLAPCVGSPEVEKCEKSQKTKLLQKPDAF